MESTNEKQCHRDDYLDILLRGNSMGVRSMLCTAEKREITRRKIGERSFRALSVGSDPGSDRKVA
jgi:hypothetical protein